MNIAPGLQEETLLLDPPSLIFILRLHLVGVARRKNAAAGALLAPPAAGGRAGRSQQAVSRQHRPHIPPPVQLPAWAQQEVAQQHGSVAAGSSLQAAGHARGRQLLDAPDALCCPITGQVCCAALCRDVHSMLQICRDAASLSLLGPAGCVVSVSVLSLVGVHAFVPLSLQVMLQPVVTPCG